MDLALWVIVGLVPAAVALVAVGWLLGQKQLGECLNAGLIFGLLTLLAYGLGGPLKAGPWIGHVWLALGALLAVAVAVHRWQEWRKDRFTRRIAKHV